MTREEFFNKLNAGAKWDVGVAIARTNPLPLDANEIFDSVASMETYIKSNALAYPGQIVVVLGETETAAYLINAVGGQGKGYSKLAATTGSGDVGEELAALVNRVSALEGYFNEGVAKEALKATQDGAGNVIADTYKTVAEFNTFKTANDAAIKEAKDIASAAVVANEAITGGTGTKITFDEKGLVTKGEAAGIADITGLQAALDAKALGTDLTALEGRVGVNENNISELQNKITGLTGAMHFIGVSTTDPKDGATVTGHTKFESGDVCLYDKKEYVYDGTKWVELGDEGSHLTKTEAAETYATKAALKIVTDDYLKASDKTALEGQIALKADQTALDETNGKVTALETKVGADADVASADGSLYARIKKEIADRESADNALSGRITTLENAKVKVDGTTIQRAEDGTLSVKEIAQSQVTGLETALAGKGSKTDVDNLKAAVGTAEDQATDDTLYGKIIKALDAAKTNKASIDTINNTLSTGVVKGVKINDADQTLPLNDGIVNIAVPKGALASKDKVAEEDLDETLLAKVNKAEYISSINETQLDVTAAKLSIKAVSTDLLTQGDKELILNGGAAN